MKKRILTSFCKSKLEMKAKNGSRHEIYTPTNKNSSINLINVITISRSPGDIDKRNLKGVALALGLTVSELSHATQCNYGCSALYVCMALNIAKKVTEYIKIDPIAYPWTHTSLGIITPLLEIAERNQGKRPGKDDPKLLRQKHQDLVLLMEIAKGDLRKYLERIETTIVLLEKVP